MTDGDEACASIAQGQFGVIAAFQARDHLSPHAIRRRVSSGRWIELLPSTYVLPGAPITDLRWVMAVALWAQARAATRAATCISHSTAAWIHRLCARPDQVHVTSPRTLGATRPSMVTHRRSLEPVDITAVSGIPVTSVARTLLDLGVVFSIDDVESCLEEALRRGAVSLPRLRWQLDRCGRSGRPGTAALRTLLDDRNRGYIPSESELELRFFRLLRGAKLPLPVRQKVYTDQGHFIARVDFVYLDRGLLIEVYGWRDHGARTRWERDIGRTTELASRGHRVIAFTWSAVTKRPQEVVQAVARALALTDPQSSFELG